MTTPTPAAKPRYALREADYDRAMPALLDPRELGEVTDKGLLYMIYRETRRTRVILQVYFTIFVVTATIGLIGMVVAIASAGSSSGY